MPESQQARRRAGERKSLRGEGKRPHSRPTAFGLKMLLRWETSERRYAVYAAVGCVGQLCWLNVCLRHRFYAAAPLWFDRARTGAGLEFTLILREISHLPPKVHLVPAARLLLVAARCNGLKAIFLVLRTILTNTLMVLITIFVIVCFFPEITCLRLYSLCICFFS